MVFYSIENFKETVSVISSNPVYAKMTMPLKPGTYQRTYDTYQRTYGTYQRTYGTYQRTYGIHYLYRTVLVPDPRRY